MSDPKNPSELELHDSANACGNGVDLPTLQLAGGETIHCGEENILLRHIVDQSLSGLARNEVDPSWFPLVLYGDALCGKSLIAHGLANAWKQHSSKESTFVLTAADLARSIQRTELADDIDRFTKQLRSAKLLVIDDIQQLAGKRNVQSWLTNLLDYRARHLLPVIVTCNAVIMKSGLNHRLMSRLNSGLSVNISLPFAKTRKDVILKSAMSFNLTLPADDVDRLVEVTSGRPVSSIQSVVASVASNKNTESTNPSERLDPNKAHMDQDELIQNLIRTTGRRFGVKVADLRGPSRRKNCVLARAVAMFIIREITPLSLVEIGQLFRNRDHSTVLHACDKIRKQITNDDSIREAIASVCKSLDLQMPPSWFKLLDAG